MLEGHAAHEVDRRIDTLVVGDIDDAFRAEPLHRLGHEVRNFGVAVGCDAGKLRQHRAAVDRAALRLECC